MSIQTRQPTGKPPWPITLVAGAEKAGKSYSCAEASGSDLIGRTFWIGIGEDDPDEYGAIPGTRFEIAVHDGTYRGIGTAVAMAVREPMVGGKPNLIVLDSGTRLWEMISDMAQTEANARRKGKSDGDSPIGMDLWNRATDRWHKIMDLLRAHQGPSIVTARLDVVTVLDDNGKPTKVKDTKIKAQKSLPYDVGVVVEMHSRGETYIMGARSLKLDLPVGVKAPLPDFTIDGLWRNLGLDDPGATAPRQHSGASGQAPQEPPAATVQPPAADSQPPGPRAVPDAESVTAPPAQHAFDPAWLNDNSTTLEGRIYEAKGDVEQLRTIWMWANGTGAPPEVLDRLKAISTGVAA